MTNQGKIILVLSAMVAMLFITNGFQKVLYDRLRKDRTRLQENQKALYQYADFYRTAMGESVAEIDRIRHTKTELEKYNKALAGTIERLNIRLKDLHSTSTTGTQTRYEVKVAIRDSIVPKSRDSPADTLRCVDFADNWLTINGCKKGNNFEGIIQSRDTLIQVVSRERYRFLFISWGTKRIKQTITSKNPHTQITAAQYIEIE